MHSYNYIIMYLIAATIRFDQPGYSVDESSKLMQPVLVLSKPQSTDITVAVIDSEITAASEFYK